MKKSFYMEALNSDLLDSSNFDGEGVSPEDAATLAQMGKGLFQNFKRNKTDYQKNLKSACGSTINIGRKAKDKYAKCVTDFDMRQTQIEAEKAKIAQADSDARVAEASAQERIVMSQKPMTETPKKFLGMPMGVGIAVTVLATAALGLIVYKKVLKR